MLPEFRLPSLYHQQKDECMVIAHRGASAYYPENTMAAFKGAVAMKADMIELDVMLSSDGVPVVFHDAQLDRRSNGQGLVSYHTLKELKDLDVGSWFDAEFAGESIPTLEEVLVFTSGRMALNIEIKTEAVTAEVQNGVEERCLQLVRKYDMQNHVLFSSFNYRAVEHLKELDSVMPVALLYNWSSSNGLLPSELIKKFKADAFNCSYRQFSEEWSGNLSEYHIPHFIYTVDRRNRIHKLLEAGVNGIFTNKPDLLKSVIDQRSSH